MHGTDNTRLMKVPEVADNLGMTVSWVHDNWKPLGLPFIKIGNGLRMRPSDLNEWLEAQRVAA